jgi:hypothetical protein
MRLLHALTRAAGAAVLGAAVLLAPLPHTSTPASAERPFVYGVTIADASAAPGHGFDLARRAGFTRAYVVLDWQSVSSSRGAFAWDQGRANDLDNFLAAARAHGLRLIVRLGKPASWAGSPAQLSAADMESFAAGVAARARGVATAYEVLNEPNLSYEWGATPDPAGYARLLAAARRGIKRADPDALVLSAGLAPHTGNAPGTIEDVDFLRGMYAAGARGTFDALGIHPYGGNSAPDSDPAACGICFRRAEAYRAVMVEQGDAATPAWVTEFGYLHTTGTDLGQYNWLKIGPDQQAAYLTGAFRYGYEQWPWLTGMVAFNMDFDTVSWNPPTLGAYWFALLNPDRSSRPVYGAMRDLPKPGASALLPVTAPAASTTMASAPVSAVPASKPAAAPVPAPSVVGAIGDVVCQSRGGTAICGLVGSLIGRR